MTEGEGPRMTGGGEGEDDRKGQRQKKEHCTMRWRGYEIGGQWVSLRKRVGFSIMGPV